MPWRRERQSTPVVSGLCVGSDAGRTCLQCRRLGTWSPWSGSPCRRERQPTALAWRIHDEDSWLQSTASPVFELWLRDGWSLHPIGLPTEDTGLLEGGGHGVSMVGFCFSLWAASRSTWTFSSSTRTNLFHLCTGSADSSTSESAPGGPQYTY